MEKRKERQMKCGATGNPCPYSADEKGVSPCAKCEIGIEFRKNFGPLLHDEDWEVLR